MLRLVSAILLPLLACTPSSSGLSDGSSSGVAARDFHVLDVDITPGVKLSMNVRLARLLSEAELGALSSELRARCGGESLPLAFVTYYLEGMDVGYGAWATAHHHPDLTVMVLGGYGPDPAVVREGFARSGRVWYHPGAMQGTYWIEDLGTDSATMVQVFHDGTRSESALESVGEHGEFDALFRRSESRQPDYWSITPAGILRSPFATPSHAQDPFIDIHPLPNPKDAG